MELAVHFGDDLGAEFLSSNATLIFGHYKAPWHFYQRVTVNEATDVSLHQ